MRTPLSGFCFWKRSRICVEHRHGAARPLDAPTALFRQQGILDVGVHRRAAAPRRLLQTHDLGHGQLSLKKKRARANQRPARVFKSANREALTPGYTALRREPATASRSTSFLSVRSQVNSFSVRPK